MGGSTRVHGIASQHTLTTQRRLQYSTIPTVCRLSAWTLPWPCSLSDFDVSSMREFKVDGADSKVVVGCGGLEGDAVCIHVDGLKPNHVLVFRVAAVFEQGITRVSHFQTQIRFPYAPPPPPPLTFPTSILSFLPARILTAVSFCLVPSSCVFLRLPAAGKSTYSESSPAARTLYLGGPSRVTPAPIARGTYTHASAPCHYPFLTLFCRLHVVDCITAVLSDCNSDEDNIQLLPARSSTPPLVDLSSSCVPACCSVTSALGAVSVQLRFNSVAHDGGLPVLGYVVSRQQNWLGDYSDEVVLSADDVVEAGGTQRHAASSSPRPAAVTLTVSGLLPGTAYRCVRDSYCASSPSPPPPHSQP